MAEAPTRTAWAPPALPAEAEAPEEEEEDSPEEAEGRWAYEADAAVDSTGIENRTLVEALADLAKVVYAPPCDVVELRRRLGVADPSGGDAPLNGEDLSRRLRRRAMALKMPRLGPRAAARLARAASDADAATMPELHGILATFFGRDPDALASSRRGDALRLLRGHCGALRKALADVREGELLDADRAILIFRRAGLPLTPNAARDAVAAVARATGQPRPTAALGERDWVAPSALLDAARGAVSARRDALAGRAYDLAAARLGGSGPPAAATLARLLPGAPTGRPGPPPPGRAAFVEALGGARPR